MYFINLIQWPNFCTMNAIYFFMIYYYKTLLLHETEYLEYNGGNKEQVLAPDATLAANEWALCAYAFLKYETFDCIRVLIRSYILSYCSNMLDLCFMFTWNRFFPWDVSTKMCMHFSYSLYVLSILLILSSLI